MIINLSVNGTVTIAYPVSADPPAAKVFSIRGFVSIYISLSIHWVLAPGSSSVA